MWDCRSDIVMAYPSSWKAQQMRVEEGSWRCREVADVSPPKVICKDVDDVWPCRCAGCSCLQGAEISAKQIVLGCLRLPLEAGALSAA